MPASCLGAAAPRRPLVAAVLRAGQPARCAPVAIGVDVVRDRHRIDEVLLEARLDGGLDLLDAPHDLLDLGAGGAVQERDPGTGAGGVPGGSDLLGIAVRDQAEHERVDRVDVRPERAGEPDAVDVARSRSAPSAAAARVERGLGQLDLPDVVLA